MKRKIFAVMAAAVLAAGTAAWGEAQAAKDYVKAAQDLVDSKDYDGANAKLELAETELDGVDAATKGPIEDSIKGVKASIAKANLAGDAEKYHRKIGTLMDDIESAIGNQATWPGAETNLKELFDNPAAQAAIPDEIEAAKKKYATFAKLNAKKVGVIVGAQVEDAMKQLDAKWAEDKPKFSDPNANPADKTSAIDEMTRAMEETKQQIALLPADSDAAKGDLARVAAINTEFSQIALADKAKDVLARLKESFDGYKDEYTGWEKETGPAPTWAEYKSNQNDTIEAFNEPKSKGLISRTDNFLKDLENNDDYKTVAEVPEVKAYVGQLRTNRDTAYLQMLGHVRPLVAEGIAAGGDKLSGLKDDVRLALGENSIEGLALQDAIQKKIDGATAAAANADAAQGEWYKKMTAAATAAWPDIAGQFSAEQGFDPNNAGAFAGKTIKITTDNLMGYRFQPGDFEFATTLSGVPVAGHFDPELKAAIAAVEAKMGRSLGDNDNDGKWTVYAVVTGKTGRMMARKQAEGDVKVDGEKVGTVTSEYSEPVDAPIITVVAAKCGPFVGGKGVGEIQPDGTIAK